MYQKNFGPKMAHPRNSGLTLRIFFKFCRMKRASRYMKVLLVAFFRKKFIWGNLIFLAFRLFFTVWLGMVKLSQATVDWMLKKSGHNFFHDYYWKEDMIRILKQWRHNFLGKYLCGGYCMHIMWSFCVEVKIQGFVKFL